MAPYGGVAMGIYEFEGKKPSIGEGSFIHPEATIIGNVTLGKGCYVGAGARIRGDWGRIVIGCESNIQENCITLNFYLTFKVAVPIQR
jgi:carbonic anhydrase/acetyltransferase-like protein (isoleucine patch superfamily)